MLDDDPPEGCGWDGGWVVWCKAHASKPFGASLHVRASMRMLAAFNPTPSVSPSLPLHRPQVSMPPRGTACSWRGAARGLGPAGKLIREGIDSCVIMDMFAR